MIGTALFFIGSLILFVLAFLGLVALLVWVMPEDSRVRAIPQGTARNRSRVTDPQIKSAHAITNAEDLAHRRELAEGRV